MLLLMVMTVVINSPSNGATLSGTVNVTATYTGAGFDIATCTLDGKQLASDSAQPLSFSIDTTKVADGDAKVLIVAVRYKKGANFRWQKAQITVNVKNVVSPPTGLSIQMNIANGATLSGSVPWEATVSGGTPDRVAFLIDGVEKWSETFAPYKFNGDAGGFLDTNTLSNGAHTLTCRAIVSTGTSPTTSASVNINNTTQLPPNVARSNPTAQVTS